MDTLNLGIPLFLLEGVGDADTGIGLDKIPLVDFSCSRSMPRTSFARQFQPLPGPGPFFGAGRLLAVPILTSQSFFVSLPLASSVSVPGQAVPHRGTSRHTGGTG